MFMSDQPRTNADLNFRLLGIPVRVNPWFWLMAVLLGPLQAKPILMVMWVVVVFVSILVHEMGHALVIRGFGWWPSILLYSFGGLAMYQPTRQVPRKQIMISLAGPAAGFLLAFATLALARAAGYPFLFHFGAPYGITFLPDFEHMRIGANGYVVMFVYQLLEVNIWWGLINLLPVWPLDGGHVCYELLNELRVPDALAKALMVSVVLAVAVAAYAAIRLSDIWLAMMFGYLAYNSFATLQSYQGRGGGYGGRW